MLVVAVHRLAAAVDTLAVAAAAAAAAESQKS